MQGLCTGSSLAGAMPAPIPAAGPPFHCDFFPHLKASGKSTPSTSP